MSNPENPYDRTIWDPQDPEQAIEDPMHGSAEMLRLLDIPPMPKADGTYHVFGGLYLCGTTSFDADGRPFTRISADALRTATRDSYDMMDWIEKHRAGELPPVEEMAYPEFRYNERPYIIFD